LVRRCRGATTRATRVYRWRCVPNYVQTRKHRCRDSGGVCDTAEFVRAGLPRAGAIPSSSRSAVPRVGRVIRPAEKLHDQRFVLAIRRTVVDGYGRAPNRCAGCMQWSPEQRVSGDTKLGAGSVCRGNGGCDSRRRVTARAMDVSRCEVWRRPALSQRWRNDPAEVCRVD
jgi:hypothetical protein